MDRRSKLYQVTGQLFNRPKPVTKPIAQSTTLCVEGSGREGLILLIESLIDKWKKKGDPLWIILFLQYRHGLRVSEVLNIMPSHYRQGKRVFIPGLKFSENRIIDCWEVWSYLSNFGSNALPPFGHMDRYYVYRNYKRNGLVLGFGAVNNRAVTHVLRHLFVQSAAVDSEGLRAAQLSVGHKNVSNTKRYAESAKRVGKTK